MYSAEIYNEMISQGADEESAWWIARRFDTKEQQQIMMEYLKSIRQEKVKGLEVLEVAKKIAGAQNVND